MDDEIRDIIEEPKEFKAPCGAVLPSLQAMGGHVNTCPKCRSAKKRGKSGTAGASEKDKVTEPVVTPSQGAADYIYPGPGPERLLAILHNRKLQKSEAERITQSFANNRQFGADFHQLLYFLQYVAMLDVHTAHSVATEYFGAPPLGQGMSGYPGTPGFPGMGVPGMPYPFPGAFPGFPGQPFSSIPSYGPAPYGTPQGYPYSYGPPPQQTTAQTAPSDGGTAAAAIQTLGSVVEKVMDRNGQPKDSNPELQATLQQFSERMNERVENMKTFQEYQDKVNSVLLGMKEAQMQALQQQHESLVAKIQQLENRNPVLEFTTWKQAVEGYAKDMGFSPPGSQDIYGALSQSIKEVNETLRSIATAAFGRAPKDKSLDERRRQAEIALSEEQIVKRAMDAVRRAEHQKQAQGLAPKTAGPEPEPQTETRLTQSRPASRMEVKGSKEGEHGLRVPSEGPRREDGDPGEDIPAGEGREGSPEASPAGPRKVRYTRRARSG